MPIFMTPGLFSEGDSFVACDVFGHDVLVSLNFLLPRHAFLGRPMKCVS